MYDDESIPSVKPLTGCCWYLCHCGFVTGTLYDLKGKSTEQMHRNSRNSFDSGKKQTNWTAKKNITCHLTSAPFHFLSTPPIDVEVCPLLHPSEIFGYLLHPSEMFTFSPLHPSETSDREEWSWQKVFQFKQLEEDSWKYQGFNGIQTRDLRDTGAMLHQLKTHIGSEVS